ncbi:antigen peptide transporter 2-like [Pelobates cultripes]|uniref:Antigen peptide transporter 2-like n=1 Tax=Pelobates cultripes TaxID=61616 RepID=A0AAD1SXV7_PELCU|nr:antigen peptide transporter 2-like [Pelobates cultripes]
MTFLWFYFTVLILDSSLTYISSSIVYTHFPYDLQPALWIVCLIKFFVLGIVSCKLYRPAWVSSSLLYILTMCLTPPLYQTLRLHLTSHSPELYSILSHSIVSHLTLLTACLLWDLVSPHILPKESSEEEKTGQKKNRENFIRLVTYSKADWLFLSGAFVFLSLALICEMFIPFYMGRVIDILSSKYKETEFLVAIFYMSFFSISSSVSAGCRGGLFIFSLYRLTRRLRILLFRAVIKQDIAFFETTKTGDITSRLSNDTARVSRAIAGNVNITLRSLVKCIGVYSFMISISWQLTLLTFLSSPFTWIIQKLYNHYHEDLVQKVQDSVARSSDIAKEILESVRTVHSFNAAGDEAKRYEDSLQEIHKLQSYRDMVQAVYLLLIRTTNLLTQVAMLFYGQILIEQGFISSGQMVSFILYQMESGDHIRTIVYMLSEMTHSAGAAQKVFQYLDREPLVSTSGSHSPDKLRGCFEFRNVTFTYPSRQEIPALQDISFTLPPGSITALVGPSGGGKTTCVSLLERFYDPSTGEILLDGKPLHQYKHQYLHAKVALVAQEPVLFSGSVKENIGYGLKDASMNELQRAARRANAETFILGMEKGYDTDVGENGGQLGAGQKQRLAIARALARDPQLLILDEASSCLDAETEHEIQKSLQGIDGLSLLIIAHRLRTVQKADQILVLEGGRLVEHGTHGELVKTEEGVYYKLLHGHLLQNGD